MLPLRITKSKFPEYFKPHSLLTIEPIHMHYSLGVKTNLFLEGSENIQAECAAISNQCLKFWIC